MADEVIIENALELALSTKAVSKITNELYVAPQVTDQTLEQVAKAGIKAVFNLRLANEPDFKDEAELVHKLGMKYYHVPLAMSTPAEVDHALGELDAAQKPVLVHCRTMMRAAAMGLLHTATRYRMSQDQVFEKAHDMGFNCSDKPHMKQFVFSYLQNKLEAASKLGQPTQISDTMWVFPQIDRPTLESLVKTAGIKAVLNLRDVREKGQLGLGVLATEKKMVEELGLNYANIPTVAGEEPAWFQMKEILAALDKLPSPFLVHCRTGKRSIAVMETRAHKFQLAEMKFKDLPQGKPTVQCIPHYPTATCVYVVTDPETKATAIVDCVMDYEHNAGAYYHAHADAVHKFCVDSKLDVQYIVETHVHADHLTAAQYLKEKFGGKPRVVIGEHITDVQTLFAQKFNLKDEKWDGSQFDMLMKDEGEFKLGNVNVKVLYTPGHTPACMTWLFGDCVFTGDTLFLPDVGTARCDFPKGSAQQMYDSCRRIMEYNPKARIFVGHDYPPASRSFMWECSLEDQMLYNKMVHFGINKEDFVKIRNARDTGNPAPNLLFPSIQYNMRGGRFPTAEDNKVSYFKIPCTAIERKMEIDIPKENHGAGGAPAATGGTCSGKAPGAPTGGTCSGPSSGGSCAAPAPATAGGSCAAPAPPSGGTCSGKA